MTPRPATDEAEPADLFDLPPEPLAEEPNAAPIATLPPYPAYKSSGVDWLGDVPEGWDVRRLRLLAEGQPNRQRLRPPCP